MKKNIIWKPVIYNSYHDGNNNSVYTIEEDDKTLLFGSVSDLSSYIINGELVDYIEIKSSLLIPILDMESYKFSDVKMAAILLNTNGQTMDKRGNGTTP
jgi:hypothetical protein